MLDLESISNKAEPACPALLAVVEKKRRVVYAKPGSDDERYLNYLQALGAVGGPENLDITLRPSPRKITVLEEFLHGTQTKLGIIERNGIRRSEVHVKEFMCRQRRRMKICDYDTQILRGLLEREKKLLELGR